MQRSSRKRLAWVVLSIAIAVVWGVNGLWCKVLGGVPRHEAIVARVLAAVVEAVNVHSIDVATVAAVLTRLIGVAELCMLVWFVSGRFSRANAAAQVVIVMTMNVIEQLLAPELLLFGPWNFVWASCFCVAVFVRTRLHLQQEGAA